MPDGGLGQFGLGPYIMDRGDAGNNNNNDGDDDDDDDDDGNNTNNSNDDDDDDDDDSGNQDDNRGGGIYGGWWLCKTYMLTDTTSYLEGRRRVNKATDINHREGRGGGRTCEAS